MNTRKYIAVIQKNHIGNIIDIFDNTSEYRDFDPYDFIVCTIDDALKYKKQHPEKKFFGYQYNKELEDFLSSKGAI